MRNAVFPQVPQRLDYEATYEALQRLGGTVEDSRLGLADLRYRTDLLEGVVAYGNTSMSKNAFIMGEKWLPFNAQIGPLKGVRIVPWGNGYGYELLSQGLWRVDVTVTVWNTIYTGDNWNDLDIAVFRPGAGVSEDHRKRFMARADENSRVTIHGVHSFVIPEPGYRVVAMGRTGRWRRYQGGTLWSTFSINKWDNNTTAMPPSEVDNDADTPSDG